MNATEEDARTLLAIGSWLTWLGPDAGSFRVIATIGTERQALTAAAAFLEALRDEPLRAKIADHLTTQRRWLAEQLATLAPGDHQAAIWQYRLAALDVIEGQLLHSK